MKRLIICSTVLLIVCSGTFGQSRSSRARGSAQGGAKAKVEELLVYPSKVTQKDSKYSLLPDPNNQNDGDAANLYVKAVKAIPKNSKRDEIRKWMKSPLDKLPVKRVEAALKPYQPALKLLDEAANSKQCNWPSIAVGQMPKNHKEYRPLAQVLAVQARLQIAQGQYDQAVDTIRTGLNMGRNLGRSPTLIQGMIGTAIAAVMLEPTKELMQTADGPNLYSALGDLPSPLVDMNKALDAEMANIDNQSILIRRSMRKILEPAHARVRLTMKRLDRSVAALQVIEAIRLYAGKNGKFPESLDKINDIKLPQDPVTEKPFEYSSSGSEASLKGPIPKGGHPRDAIEYKLKLQKKK
jgi:hypothetical protein